jgi:hypothetical protein
MSQDVSSALAQIRRESLDMYNRLHSIAEDVAFVNLVHGMYAGLPLMREYASLDCRCRPTEVHSDQQICDVELGTLTLLS